METTGLNHIILTVSNAERSRSFYQDLLGFEAVVLDEGPDGGFMFTSGGVMVFFYASRHPIEGDRFNEFRIGLDHLSFNITSREELDQLAEKLIQAGVDTQGVEQFAPTGNWYVAFRDTDNIQLEYWLS
jgi:catechol 2,3-dioxygenase-like lactoylglutathione lyase family enzyme